MRSNSPLVPVRFRRELGRVRDELEVTLRQAWAWLQRRWPALLGLALALYLFTHRDITVDFAMAKVDPGGTWLWTMSERTALTEAEEGPRNISQLTGHHSAEAEDEQADKRRRQLAYVAEYADLAEEEMRRFRIPASITLAQALLESDIGRSRLARENRNHFGIKCFSRTCEAGHCSNFSDDSHKDFFRIFGSAKESFRAHSQLLRKPRYERLFQLDKHDYEGWARGLSRAGYATDPRYSEKLIKLIEELDLDQYDR